MNNNRILAKGCIVSNDTFATQLNNNDVIIGPSGSGKTQGYVLPNILEASDSLVVIDTKGNLSAKTGDYLTRKGYMVLDLNFKDMVNSVGYNPLDYIRYDKKNGKYNEQDIMSVACALCPRLDNDEPFWDESAKLVITAIIAFVLEATKRKDHTMAKVVDMVGAYDPEFYSKIFGDLHDKNPDSFAYRKYSMFKILSKSEKTEASVMQFVNTSLDVFNFDGARHILTSGNKLDFTRLGKEKTALFVEVSDVDRSMDAFVNVFLSQLFSELINCADVSYANRLAVPVRIILDDFATNAPIENFDNIISVIRSRDIYVSVILQSITQLDAIYGAYKARTILMNADHTLYLGGCDLETVRYFSERANLAAHKIHDMPVSECLLFERGCKARRVERYDVSMHPDADQICLDWSGHRSGSIDSDKNNNMEEVSA